MRGLVTGLLVAAVSAVASGCADDSAPRRAPSIAFGKTTYDFGQVPAGTVIRHDFEFANDGDLDLTIDTLKTGCNCMTTLMPSSTIPPHGRGSVEVQLDTGGQTGKERRTITVYANDPQRRVTVLSLNGEVTTDVSVQPTQMYIGHVHPGDVIGQTVTVLAAADAATIEAAPQTRCCDVRTVPLTDGRHGEALTLTIKDDLAPGPIDDVVQVHTSTPAMTIPVSVVGVVDPDLVATPDRLDFEDVVAGTSPSRALLIDNSRHAPLKAVDVVWPAQLGRAELQPVRAGFRYRLVVTLADRLAPGWIDSVLEIRSGDTILHVPVTAAVQSR